MKTKIYNYDKIEEKEIHDRIIRVKALMINSRKELLFGEAYGTIQFPGGHQEGNETLNETLKREIKEETGIVLQQEYEPFFAIKYLMKDCPVRGNNRSIEIYYFVIKTDEPYHLEKLYLDDREKNGNFKLFYVPLKKVKKVVKSSLGRLPINDLVVSEMLQALRVFKKEW